jgi:hypothetical protein
VDTTGSVAVTAKDMVDARRVLALFEKRGQKVIDLKVRRVQQETPVVQLSMKFDGPSLFRSVAKTALTASCVLYGNDAVRRHSDIRLRTATRFGTPDICEFAGWDFVNEWPMQVTYSALRSRAATSTSGFVHHVLVSDVGADWIASVQLFGYFRYSVWLGPATGLPTKGLAFDPRTGVRLNARAEAATSYLRRHPSSVKDEHSRITDGLKLAVAAVGRTAVTESRDAWVKGLEEELHRDIAAADSTAARDCALRAWSERLAATLQGARWEESLDVSVIDDPTPDHRVEE